MTMKNALTDSMSSLPETPPGGRRAQPRRLYAYCGDIPPAEAEHHYDAYHQAQYRLEASPNRSPDSSGGSLDGTNRNNLPRGFPE